MSEQIFKGDEARDWLEAGPNLINSTWRKIRMETTYWTEDGVDEGGRPARLVTTGYAITRRRGLGLVDSGRDRIWFDESRVQEIRFVRSSEGCLWGAFYRVTILLSGGLVELEYDPAASEGGVFPREGFRVEFGYRRMVISASPKSA